MAKISLTKLGLTKNQEVLVINHNGEDIEVKQYLPINEKLAMISEIVNIAYDADGNFANPVKIAALIAVKIIQYYTNINMTQKQQEDFAKLYDLLVGSDLITEIQMAIPKQEMSMVVNGVWDTIEAFYKYKNSALGILDTISADYSNLNFDAEEIKKKIGDPNNLALLNDILKKLG